MKEKKDVETREDLEQMLAVFYARVFKDELIGHFFTEVVQLDMKQHLPVITDFWEGIVFNRDTYRGNAMTVHQQVHRLSPIGKQHLERWLQLFQQTVDEFFEGERATLMKQRAVSIATLMTMKFNNSINKL